MPRGGGEAPPSTARLNTAMLVNLSMLVTPKRHFGKTEVYRRLSLGVSKAISGAAMPLWHR